MRPAILTLSALLLSGCSWLNVGYGGQYGYGGYAQTQGGCGGSGGYPTQQAAIVYGCNPTAGVATAFPQTANFSGGYTSGNYGTHANVAGSQSDNYQPQKRVRKPRLRGSLSFGIDNSLSGDVLNYNSVPKIDPTAGYDPDDFHESRIEGSHEAGAITQTVWSAGPQNAGGTTSGSSDKYEEAIKPNVSFEELYKRPVSLSAGLEYIYSPDTTLFANLGYAFANGGRGHGSSINASLYQTTTTTHYTPDVAIPGAFIGGPPITNVTTIRNQEIARFAYNFTDMKRVDLDIGGRHYFDPVLKSEGYKTLTPFVGASIGLSHHNAVSFDVTQEQLQYSGPFAGAAATSDFYNVDVANEKIDLYEAQWVSKAQLHGGMEWQVTPKTALAFETGLRIEGARNYVNGVKSDKQLTIPLTVRGSYNF